MNNVIDSFVGRSAVFIETGDACLGTIESVVSDSECVRAVFKLVPGSFRCRLRLIQHPGDAQIDEPLVDPPFGDTWDVMVSNNEFYMEDDHWHASFLFGGGFRVFFKPAFAQRFAVGDVKWLDEFYRDSEDEGDGDTDGGS